MKKILLLLFPLLLLSCNNTGDEPDEPKEGTVKTYDLWVYPSHKYDLTLEIWLSRATIEIPKSDNFDEPIKIWGIPINDENREVFSLHYWDGETIHVYGQSKYYEIRGMQENKHYRIECIDEIPEILEEQVESIDIDIKSVSDYK